MPRDPDTVMDAADAGTIGLLGATSFVGRAVVAAWRRRGAAAESRRILAFSRAAAPADMPPGDGVVWRRLTDGHDAGESIPSWMAVCPLWVVPEHFRRLESAGARRLVAVSSTSRFTKRTAATVADRALAARLAAAEEAVLGWARGRGVATTLLRPTMIYDGVHDRNVARIAAVIRRWNCFPVAGAAAGLRQPVHVDDVAAACLAAVDRAGLLDAYEISGGETLSYRAMVRRIFGWLGREPRIVTVPRPLVRAAVPLAGLVPPVGRLASMADRMNQDLVFDHAAATRDLGFEPRPFGLFPQPTPDRAAAAPPAPAVPWQTAPRRHGA